MPSEFTSEGAVSVLADLLTRERLHEHRPARGTVQVVLGDVADLLSGRDGRRWRWSGRWRRWRRRGLPLRSGRPGHDEHPNKCED